MKNVRYMYSILILAIRIIFFAVLSFTVHLMQLIYIQILKLRSRIRYPIDFADKTEYFLNYG